MRAMAKASRTLVMAAASAAGQARQRLASAGSAPALGASPWLVGRAFPQAPRAACLVPAARNSLPQVGRPCWRRGSAPARPQLARLRPQCLPRCVCPRRCARRSPSADCPLRPRGGRVAHKCSWLYHSPRTAPVCSTWWRPRRPARGHGAVWQPPCPVAGWARA
jgi:hypothetical protein